MESTENTTLSESTQWLHTIMENTTLSKNVQWLNTTMGHKHLTPFQQAVITACYLVGIFGNLIALILLCKKSLRSNNQKHNLILKCLSANDLTALLGMLILMYIQLYLTTHDSLWVCRARVVCRIFGLQSGCVAIVMAVERWLALTKPFFYQKHVTVVKLRRCILALWSFSLVLVCMPFLGFGLYYEERNKEKICISYKDATLPLDVAYAYIYFTLGMSLCIGIVCCNIAVMRSLCFKGYTYSGSCAIRIREPVLMRRMSRTVSKMSTASTREEIAFGRLMGFLCVVFVVFWIPQLLTIPIQQLRPQDRGNRFHRIPDMLMALHFVLDPYIYVLQRSSAFRRLFCSSKTHYAQYRPSIRMLSPDQMTNTPFMAKI